MKQLMSRICPCPVVIFFAIVVSFMAFEPAMAEPASAASGQSTGRDSVTGRGDGFVILPRFVVVAPGTSVQFTALYTRRGRSQTPAQVTWHVPSGSCSASGRFQAPEGEGTFLVKAQLPGHHASARVVVKAPPAPQRPKQPRPSDTFQIIRTTYKNAGFVNRKVETTVKVSSKNARSIALYAVDKQGTNYRLIARQSCHNGDEVVLTGKFEIFKTRKLRYILQDEKERSLATVTVLNK